MNPVSRSPKIESRAPFNFGYHPDFEKDYKRRLRRARRQIRRGQLEKGLSGVLGEDTPLSKLADSRHPEVFIIPRDRHLCVLDGWGDNIGFERTILPFSSTDFYVELDEDKKSLFHQFARSEAFSRLGQINQLGYLVPPRPAEWDESIRVSYLLPQFSHNRWLHSLLVAILIEIILARNGFSEKERAPIILTAGCHDIAMPAGGDSIKRVDPRGLNEENNFAWVLEYHDLAKRWAKLFGFDLALAQSWVRNEGVFGQLLDVIDKICYTALDCYHLGMIRAGQVRRFCLEHPLVIDVWQNIQFTPDRTRLAFTKPERLFHLLLLRAYEFQELLFNPYSRVLDLFLKKLVQPLYEDGSITKEHLLIQDDDWLHRVLNTHYPDKIKPVIDPEELSWKKFETSREQEEFCVQLGDKIERKEHIAGFNPGLDWPVFDQEKIAPLREVISRDEIEQLEGIVASTRGYYVYYRT